MMEYTPRRPCSPVADLVSTISSPSNVAGRSNSEIVQLRSPGVAVAGPPS